MNSGPNFMGSLWSIRSTGLQTSRYLKRVREIIRDSSVFTSWLQSNTDIQSLRSSPPSRGLWPWSWHLSGQQWKPVVRPDDGSTHSGFQKSQRKEKFLKLCSVSPAVCVLGACIKCGGVITGTHKNTKWSVCLAYTLVSRNKNQWLCKGMLVLWGMSDWGFLHVNHWTERIFRHISRSANPAHWNQVYWWDFSLLCN